MKKYLTKYIIKLWYRMAFENDRYSKRVFELIENVCQVTENYKYLIIAKNHYK